METINKNLKCKGQTEVFARIVGYYRPQQCANIGKRAEIKERKDYKINKKF